MRKGQPGSALGHLRVLFTSGTPVGLSDGELLERYTAHRAEASDAAAEAEMAFAALVDRHGAMVWGVCRRVLGDTHEAEDAFQATFLVLVRKAGSVRLNGSLGRWLYGVAHRVALRARHEADRRGASLDRAHVPSGSNDPVVDVELRDLRRAVGEELDRLPAKYRCPVELCHLQGMTYDQAARQLDWPVATVKSRLNRARLRLRKRLTQRGLAPGTIAVGLSTALTIEARAAVPPQLVRSTIRAIASCAAGAFPEAVVALTRGVLMMMIWNKVGLVAAGTLAVAVGVTAQVLSQPAANGGNRTPRPIRAVARPIEKLDEPQEDPRWTRHLPSGATIEVIGVSTFPSGSDTWWRPGGTPLRPAPCDWIQAKVAGDAGVIQKRIAARLAASNLVQKLIVVRLSHIPDGAEHQWSVIEAVQGGAEEPARRDGKPAPGLRITNAVISSHDDACTIVFKVAAGPWKTIQKWGKSAGSVGSTKASYIFGDAIATKTGTTLSVTHNIQDQSVRLVAVDGGGQEHPAKVRSAAGVKGFTQIVAEFDLRLENIEVFRLQTRPYEQIEIPGVALKRKS